MAGFAAKSLSALSDLWRWWTAELAALVPDRLRRRLQHTADRLVLLLGHGNAALYLETRQELRLLGEIDLRGEAEPHHRIAQILRRHGLAHEMAGGRVGVALRLAPDRVLRTVVDLPLAAESNLNEVVSFELDRHTPFRAEQAVFAHRIIERDVTAQRLRIDLTVVPRALIAEVMIVAGRLHLDPQSVDVAERGSNWAASGNLLPDAGQTGARHSHSILTYGLSAMAAALAVVAIVLHLSARQHSDDAIGQEVAAAKKSVTAAAALQKEIEALRKDERFLIDRKRERMTVSRLLLDTTHILPDDTWLSEWQISGAEVQLAGVTGSASALVERLEQSKVFKDTTFQSPTVQDTKSARERFHFSTRVVEETP